MDIRDKMGSLFNDLSGLILSISNKCYHCYCCFYFSCLEQRLRIQVCVLGRVSDRFQFPSHAAQNL